MAELATAPSHATDHAADHDHGSHVRTYIRVFISLAILTAIEYFYAFIFKDAFLSLVLGLMTWALIKAALVGLYFMHVKYEGRWVYFMLIPAGFLATVLVCALLPDMALQPSNEELTSGSDDDDSMISTPPPMIQSPAASKAEPVHSPK